MKYFAVRMGNYVEFRVANRPPRARVSKLTRMIPTKQLVFDPVRGYVQRSVNTKITLKTVFYVGGRVLGTAKLARFQRYPDAPKFKKRGILEVSESLKKAVLRGGL